MAIQKTTPGSYEAPVQGIVDYGAFQRGFNSSFRIPQPEEEKDPLEYVDPDGTYVTEQDRENDKGGLYFGKNAVEALNNNQEVILLGDKPNYVAAATNQDQQKINSLNKKFQAHSADVKNFQAASAIILENDEIIDRRLTQNIAFATNSNGQSISVLDFYGSELQNKGAWGYNISQKGSRTITQVGVNGYNRTLSGFNATNASKFFVTKVDLNSQLGEYTKTNRGKILSINSADYETDTRQTTTKGASTATTTTTTTNKLRPKVLEQIETKAQGFAQEFFSKKDNDAKASLYADILYGEDNLTNYNEKKSGGFIEGYDGGVFTSKIAKDEDGNPAKFTFEQFSNGEVPDPVKNELIRDYLVNYNKINASYGAFTDPNLNNHAVKTSDLKDSKKAIAPDDDQIGSFSINFGGTKLDDDLLKRTRELLSITSIQTNDQGVITPASRDNVVAYISNQILDFETTKKGTEDKVSGKIDGVTSDMITIKSEKITQGPDKGQTKAIISIQPKPQQVEQDGPIVEFEPIEYDLRKESDIEKLLFNQYGFATDKGKKFKAQYDPVLSYLKALRKGLINEDGTPVRELTPN